MNSEWLQSCCCNVVEAAHAWALLLGGYSLQLDDTLYIRIQVAGGAGIAVYKMWLVVRSYEGKLILC